MNIYSSTDLSDIGYYVLLNVFQTEIHVDGALKLQEDQEAPRV